MVGTLKNTTPADIIRAIGWDVDDSTVQEMAVIEHAQLVGVLSFSLFLCLVVLSLFLFGSLSIFFISIGVVIYSFLMRSLFTLPGKVYVLAYLVFEAIQIGFYVALASTF
uniref:Uncharacterized protein n=1 Tax=Ditylenchus dipsaci TaxID=166011 RepID=A0A915DZH1_9BILA